RFETWIQAVTNHHAVDDVQTGLRPTTRRPRSPRRPGARQGRVVPTCKLSEHGEFFSIQFLARAIDLGQTVMGIDSRGRVTREMFAATGDPLVAHRVV